MRPTDFTVVQIPSMVHSRCTRCTRIVGQTKNASSCRREQSRAIASVGKSKGTRRRGLARQPRRFRRDASARETGRLRDRDRERKRERKREGDSRDNSRAHAGHLFNVHREQRDSSGRARSALLREKPKRRELSRSDTGTGFKIGPPLDFIRSPCALL